MALSPAEKKSRFQEESAGLPSEAVLLHLQRLDGDYWNEFDPGEIRTHLNALIALKPTQPWDIRFQDLEEDHVAVTLIGGDFTGFFAAVSGFLASEGIDIRVGKIFSFPAEKALPLLPRGGIIDFLLLKLPEKSVHSEILTRIRGDLESLFRRFEAGDATGIRVELYRRIGARLEAQNSLSASGMPLDVQYHAISTGTQIVIRGRDREAMLFCIASALSLQGLSIRNLLTSTRDDGSFEDRLTVCGPGNQPLRNSRDLEKVKAGISLMERLLQALPAATDLQAAAAGLQALVEDWLEESNALSEDGALDPLAALARVLTSGPRMWEAVSRLGPKGFRDLLTELSHEKSLPHREKHLQRLQAKRHESRTPVWSQWVQDYRDREILKAELDLLLTPSRTLDEFSLRLGTLAEALLTHACDGLASELEKQHGKACGYGLFALGKFGGEELGSGSDLELLLVYSESGETVGSESMRFGEFYEALGRRLLQALETTPGGTFALDMRLRPHGESGPLATSRNAWREYFQPGSGVLDYEKQALIRLRPIHGDSSLHQEMLQLRDQIVYTQPPVPIGHTLELHDRQIETHAAPDGGWNVKFGPGGLAELEYSVQFLQLQSGHAHPEIRRHHVSRALEALLEKGILSLAEFEHLRSAQQLLRRLINTLRLQRGLGKDLFCPSPSSPEYAFVAKKLGYADRVDFPSHLQLDRDLRQAQRTVSGFFGSRFRGATKPEWLYQSLAESLMDAESTDAEISPALERLGMRDIPRARRLFLQFFALVAEKRLAAACLLLFESTFRTDSEPETLLQRLIRHLEGLKHPDLFIRQALDHPFLMESLLLLAGSESLSELAAQEAEDFPHLAEPELLGKARLLDEFHSRVLRAMQNPDLGPDAESRLCRLRNREYLRIALRDLRYGVHVQKITFEISALSDALVSAAFHHVFRISGLSHLENRFCVLALGKLGGLELNYSSDIDLVFVADESAEGDNRECERAGRELIAFLTRDTGMGRLFRVDMNLRPWGDQGPLAGSASQYRRYFQQTASGWELQAWLKARPVCGNKAMGEMLVNFAQSAACLGENRGKVEDSMRQVRLMGLDQLKSESGDGGLAGEVKLGPGGIRTVEFFTQALQIRHGADIPELITGNTLEALGRLNRYGLLPQGKFRLLSEAYVFLRRVEHALQLQGLRQVHTLPKDPKEMAVLAQRLGYPDRIGFPALKAFLQDFRKHMLGLQPISAELFGH